MAMKGDVIVCERVVSRRADYLTAFELGAQYVLGDLRVRVDKLGIRVGNPRVRLTVGDEWNMRVRAEAKVR